MHLEKFREFYRSILYIYRKIIFPFIDDDDDDDIVIIVIIAVARLNLVLPYLTLLYLTDM